MHDGCPHILAKHERFRCTHGCDRQLRPIQCDQNIAIGAKNTVLNDQDRTSTLAQHALRDRPGHGTHGTLAMRTEHQQICIELFRGSRQDGNRVPCPHQHRGRRPEAP